MKQRILWAMLVLGTLLSGCSSSPPLERHDGEPLAYDCARFARAVSGIKLYGNASTWWKGADGRYARDTAPSVGSVLVFHATARLPSGHVAVVSRVIAGRQILVVHANWIHRRVTVDETVVDVSPGNDWSAVRVWWDPSSQLGATTYRTYGFIRPSGSLTHDAIATRARLAE